MKAIYSEFLGGLSYYDRNAPANTYNEGREIDPHRGGGYLQPGWDLATVTKSDDTPAIIVKPIVDICVDENSDDCYFIDSTDKIYRMTSLVSEGFDADFDGTSHYYYDIPSATAGESLAIYGISGTNYLLYAYNTSTAGDVGTATLGGTATFNPDYLSTDVGTGNAALQKAPHPMMEWKSYLYIGNGRYVGRFDGANDVWDATKLDLGAGWEVTALFPTENYVGVCAWKTNSAGSGYRTEARVYFWDGISALPTYWKPVADNEIKAAFNNNGEILLATYGRDLAITLRKLTDFGTEKIRKLKTSIAGTSTSFNPTTVGSRFGMESFGNRVLFGSRYLIWSYGAEEEGQPKAITIPWGQTAVASSEISVIKTVLYNKVYIAYSDHTNSKYYILKASAGNSTRATYRGNYTDMGQNIRVNYIKLYFKPLVASDSVTVTLDTDYGTSNTPQQNAGVISHTLDGAITSKKFDLGGIECHSFRPVIDWTVGGVAFSKIVVDYDFVED